MMKYWQRKKLIRQKPVRKIKTNRNIIKKQKKKDKKDYKKNEGFINLIYIKKIRKVYYFLLFFN